jgi:hypothetical protein
VSVRVRHQLEPTNILVFFTITVHTKHIFDKQQERKRREKKQKAKLNFDAFDVSERRTILDVMNIASLQSTMLAQSPTLNEVNKSL